MNFLGLLDSLHLFEVEDLESLTGVCGSGSIVCIIPVICIMLDRMKLGRRFLLVFRLPDCSVSLRVLDELSDLNFSILLSRP